MCSKPGTLLGTAAVGMLELAGAVARVGELEPSAGSVLAICSA